VRLLRITGVDLHLFDFDHDLTWMAFFLSPDEKIYGRYGGRDASGPDTRNTLAGLKFAMQAALIAHEHGDKGQPKEAAEPFYIERVPRALNFRGCIHCHQTKEIRRDDLIAVGKWKRGDIWVYPLPENVGITLEKDRENRVRSVAGASPAQRAGIQPGDVLQQINGYSVNSFADAQYALHKAPTNGQIPISWLHDGKATKADLTVADGWRKTNLTWRPSMLDLLPSLTLFGPDLDAKEKKRLGLSEKNLAFRQEKPVHSEARAMGVEENDIIIGIDNLRLEMTMREFLGYVRRNYLIGDRAALNIIRNGKRLELPIKLK
jgi:membrane-associated protease RseP (regulator of RpoE activity)